ncbi:MAG TPA: toll/interleukin-1 receptor domain-containing protein [Pseudonocardiaceae bacterium]|nr:toll/interleukin-1 receptor domain-containing protein [Pseudonocardiaceae bacterium]
MTQVFLNYRSQDEVFGVHLLDTALSERFGSDQVFLDAKSIPLGAEWEPEMFGAIEKSAALMVIMGRNWLGATDDQGVRLIDKPQDFVRREILRAHELNKKIITVRLGVDRITEHDLPVELAWLPSRQDIGIGARTTRSDLDHLADKLRALLPDLGSRQSGAPAGQASRRTYIINGKTDYISQGDTHVSGSFYAGSTVHHHHGDDGDDS